jgi:uncharacterized protein (TIRG00374 family)
VLAGVAIYIVLPEFSHVLGSWPRLRLLAPWWLVVMLAAEVASFACLVALLRMVVKARGWFAVTCAVMSGNAVTNVLPAGDAVGAGVQYRMLQRAGVSGAAAAGGLASSSLLGLAGLLFLPVFAIPALMGGVSVNAGLVHAAELGIAGFLFIVLFGALVLSGDTVLVGIALAIQAVTNRLRRRHVSDLPARFLAQRDVARRDLGRNWLKATLLVGGHIALDYLSLLAALRATGASPDPPLVLLAYAATASLALLPITPGGLGIVEASLSGLLVLANVPSSDALVATLAFRLGAFWLPEVAGGVLYLLFRRRYGSLDASTGPLS